MLQRNNSTSLNLPRMALIATAIGRLPWERSPSAR